MDTKPVKLLDRVRNKIRLARISHRVEQQGKISLKSVKNCTK